jgi:hypothetical protein
MALAMLRTQQAAPGRLWLLLRRLDETGRGVFRIAGLRELFCTPESNFHVCGWRQFRNLLRQGEGVFWQRDRERLWLRSAGKTAAALGVARLTGQPVAIPRQYLLGSIGEARAYLYASFHAGRSKQDASVQPKPISRETLTALSGLSAESQRAYEKRAGVRVKQNYAVGERLSAESEQERSWRQGRGVFQLHDTNGRLGKPGQRYLAWQLPNSYAAALEQRPKGCQKRINRSLADLFMKGITGNGRHTVEQRYFGPAAAAARGLQRQQTTEVFWRQTEVGNGRVQLWHTLQ